MTSMTDVRTIGDELLADILANPEDDTPRLIYADWLEDHDQAERAEFIRVQIALHSTVCDHAEIGDGFYVAYCNDINCRHYMMDHRADTLLHTNAIQCCTEDTPEWDWLGSGLRAMYRSVEGRADCGLPDSDLFWWDWQRGFISTIRAPLDVLLRHLPAVIRSHPVERVEATDRRPCNRCGAAGLHWHPPGGYNCDLPLKVIDLCRGNFRSEAAAADALSDALLKLARKE